MNESYVYTRCSNNNNRQLNRSILYNIEYGSFMSSCITYLWSNSIITRAVLIKLSDSVLNTDSGNKRVTFHAVVSLISRIVMLFLRAVARLINLSFSGIPVCRRFISNSDVHPQTLSLHLTIITLIATNTKIIKRPVPRRCHVVTAAMNFGLLWLYGFHFLLP